MDFPLQLKLGQTSIQLHILFESLAFFIGFRYFLYLRKLKADPIKDNNRIWIIIGATFGAFFFSRVLGALENPSIFFSPDTPLLYYYTSKTIVGGLLGGLLCVELIKLAIREKSSSGDPFVFPLMLAMVIGRIGCFTSGVYEPTFGIESSLPWAMNLGDGIMRHPVALYEILFLILFWAVLIQARRRVSLNNGILFQYFMIGYLFFRFLIDFIKPAHVLPVHLSSIQLACLGGLIYYHKTIYLSFFKPEHLTDEQQS